MTDSRSSHSTFAHILAACAASDVYKGVVSAHSLQRTEVKGKCRIISVIFSKMAKLTTAPQPKTQPPLILPVVLTEIQAGGRGRNSEYAYL